MFRIILQWLFEIRNDENHSFTERQQPILILLSKQLLNIYDKEQIFRTI